MGRFLYNGSRALTNQEQKKQEHDRIITEMLDSGDWIPVVINGHKTNYLVSFYGDIVNRTTLHHCKGTINASGYRGGTLSYIGDDGRPVPCSVKFHRVVAESWIPNPDNKPEVDHIDRDRLNNRVENLQWVTPYENSSNRDTSNISRELTGRIYVSSIKEMMRSVLNDPTMTTSRLCDIYGCSLHTAIRIYDLTMYLKREGLILDDGTVNFMWVPLKFDGVQTRYRISPYGIIITDRDCMVQGGMSEDGYNKVNITFDLHGGQKSWHGSVGTLVAMTFLPNRMNRTVVGRVDGNKLHEWVGNLTWTETSERIHHAYRRGVLTPKREDENGNNRYTTDQIRQVCEMISKMHSPNEIERVTGVSRATIASIRDRRSWRSISSSYEFPIGRFTNVGKFHMSDGTVKDDNEYTPKTNCRKYTAEERDFIFKLLDEGQLSTKEIAEKMGIPLHTIYDIRSSWLLRKDLIAFGIKIPTKGGGKGDTTGTDSTAV